MTCRLVIELEQMEDGDMKNLTSLEGENYTEAERGFCTLIFGVIQMFFDGDYENFGDEVLNFYRQATIKGAEKILNEGKPYLNESKNMYTM